MRCFSHTPLQSSPHCCTGCSVAIPQFVAHPLIAQTLSRVGYVKLASSVPTFYFSTSLPYSGASPVAQMVKNLPAMQKTWARSLGQEDLLEKGIAIHSDILAWEFHGQMSRGGATVHGVAVRQDWVTNTLPCSEAPVHHCAVPSWHTSSPCPALCAQLLGFMPVSPTSSILKLWKVKVAQLCPTLCDPMDYTVPGILQARILEWVAFPFSRGSSQPRDRTQVSRIAGGFFTCWATREASLFFSRGIFSCYNSKAKILWRQ